MSEKLDPNPEKGYEISEIFLEYGLILIPQV
jgi:hypothetical protein